PENYMVNVDPNTHAVTITGIDNDFAFGANLSGVETLKVNGLQKALNSDELMRDKGFNYCGFPPLIDRALYTRLVTDDLSWEDFCQDLPGLVSGEELNAAKGRFQELKDHARKLGEQGLVVDDWQTFQANGQSAAQFMKAQERKNYFKRDVTSLHRYQDSG